MIYYFDYQQFVISNYDNFLKLILGFESRYVSKVDLAIEDFHLAIMSFSYL